MEDMMKQNTKNHRKLTDKIEGSYAIYTFNKAIGKDPFFLEVVEYAKKISDSNSTILITGESGTGKEIFAQSIHNYGNRKNEHFIAINCAAIPNNLIESELFGYEGGAFTGAKPAGSSGKFELADRGTILLDEIGEMPFELQSRLLRVIEEGVVRRVGGSSEKVVDVRIIAASNRDLYEQMKEGNFRKDLYYRLNVLPLKLPALRDRPEDIALLFDYFMKRKAKKLNKKEVSIDDDYIQKLMGYDWPGNIRELENIVELIINTEKLPKFIQNQVAEKVVKPNLEGTYTLKEMEQRHIQNVLLKHHGNITIASKELGISRTTLYRKLELYGIDVLK
jgi:transcriptional regulator with PAS, ATPase and Fis domain